MHKTALAPPQKGPEAAPRTIARGDLGMRFPPVLLAPSPVAPPRGATKGLEPLPSIGLALVRQQSAHWVLVPF